MSNDPLKEAEAELNNLPPAVAEAYKEALDAMESSFNDEELSLWAKEGVSIGTQTVRVPT